MSYDNNNTGVLFEQGRKKTEKHPDFTGQAEVNGVQYRVAGWNKVSQKGAVFIKLAFTPMDQRPATNEDLPF